MIDRRLLTMAPLLLLVLAGCGSTSVPTTAATQPTTTTPAPEAPATTQHESDVDLINQLWWDQGLAWGGGFDAGVQFWVDNNYPDMGCTFDDYMTSRFPDGPIEDLLVQRVANPPTIQLDEGWTIPRGRLEGTPAKGRVYSMSVKHIRTAPGQAAEPPAELSLHVTILDGDAHMFYGCS